MLSIISYGNWRRISIVIILLYCFRNFTTFLETILILDTFITVGVNLRLLPLEGGGIFLNSPPVSETCITNFKLRFSYFHLISKIGENYFDVTCNFQPLFFFFPMKTFKFIVTIPYRNLFNFLKIFLLAIIPHENSLIPGRILTRHDTLWKWTNSRKFSDFFITPYGNRSIPG